MSDLAEGLTSVQGNPESHIATITKGRHRTVNSLRQVEGIHAAWNESIWRGSIPAITNGRINCEASGFLNELLTAAYAGAARTLRWMLEVAAIGAEYAICRTQLNAQRISDRVLVDGRTYDSGVAEAFWKQLSDWDMNRGRGRPSFADLIKNIMNHPILGPQLPEIEAILRSNLYSRLCGFVHLTPESFEFKSGWKCVLVDSFKPEDFSRTYELALETCDYIYYLLITAYAHYYGYDSPSTYLQVALESTESGGLSWLVNDLRSRRPEAFSLTSRLIERARSSPQSREN